MLLELNWINYRFDASEGYSKFGIKFIEALSRRGVQVHPVSLDQYLWPASIQHLAGINKSLISIALIQSVGLLPSMVNPWNYTMYESTNIRSEWIEKANTLAERVLVPHRFLVEIFLDRGLKIPIHVIPGGTDPVEFPIVPVSPFKTTGVYTFLVIADRGTRKGWDLAWQAFWKAFGKSKDVRFLIKMHSRTSNILNLALSDSRVRVWKETTSNMSEVYAHADCFVFPSRGEGWGMPPREFAMTGKPVICTDWSGLSNNLDKWAIPVPTNGLVPANLICGGMWANPDVDAIAEAMRWCFDNPEEARQKGLAAAEWLRSNETWDHAADKLIKLIKEVTGYESYSGFAS